MARATARTASVLLAAGVLTATPSAAFAAPQAPAAAPQAQAAPAQQNWKILWEPPSDEVTAAAYWKTMDIKGQKQKKGNWCGPAAATSALSYHASVGSGTQASLAKKMATDKIGFTSPIAMGREMTNYINKAWKTKGTKYKATRSVKNPNLWNATRYSYARGQGPLVLTVFAKKSWYPKAGKAVAHYVVIYGFDDTTRWDQSTYLIWDPAYGKRKLSAKNWEKIAYTGKFVVSW
ncbi:C39 family peptidase [Actinomadura hibisca]|uniref:C39 family peptidase n=1 Tax=Actinomadura hibisca TaxID=68565 RepID=UPI00083328C6|nr:C39 family peptidase [Actinomadura hibisca]